MVLTDGIRLRQDGMMSSQHRFIPRKDRELVPYAREIESQCRMNLAPGLWNIDVAALDRLAALVAGAESALEANAARETKNHFTVVHQQEACRALHRELGVFINYLLGNPRVPDFQINAMGIRPRHRTARSPLPPPREAPVLSVFTGRPRMATLFLSDNQAGHPTEFLTSSPRRAAHVQYRLAGAAEWENLHLTRKRHILELGQEASGRYLQVRAAWLNPRLQAGPWCDERRAMVT
jgi:hypothetical protein